MRELKDYFCTFKQENELFKIGFDAIQKIYIKHDVLRYVILRSQALDYFRGSYSWSELRCDNFYFVVYINGTTKYFYTRKHKTYHEAESALIDKLIELEKEARNGK